MSLSLLTLHLQIVSILSEDDDPHDCVTGVCIITSDPFSLFFSILAAADALLRSRIVPEFLETSS
jgi:hypothetical protein